MLRVLVVDDYRDGADSLVMMLRVLGVEARAVYDGRGALESLDDFQPSLILLDIGMPGLTGFDVARLIRQHPTCSGVTIVAVSGWSGEADREDSADAGFDQHLVKPIDLPTLRRLLASVEVNTAGAGAVAPAV